jgi:hypothetical protein
MFDLEKGEIMATIKIMKHNIEERQNRQVYNVYKKLIEFNTSSTDTLPS